MKCYVLKKGEYYLSDYNTRIIFQDDIYDKDYFGKETLNDFTIGTEVIKLFSDFDKAEDIRKLIFIETGLNLEVKLFRKEEK